MKFWGTGENEFEFEFEFEFTNPNTLFFEHFDVGSFFFVGGRRLQLNYQEEQIMRLRIFGIHV